MTPGTQTLDDQLIAHAVALRRHQVQDLADTLDVLNASPELDFVQTLKTLGHHMDTLSTQAERDQALRDWLEAHRPKAAP